MVETPLSKRLASVRFWRGVALVAGLLVVIFLSLSMGLNANQMHRIIREKAVIRAAKVQGATMARALVTDAGAGLEDLSKLQVLVPDLTRLLKEHMGVAYLCVVDPGGKIVWGSPVSLVGTAWPGGKPGDFFAQNRQTRRPGPDEHNPDILLESVTPIERKDGHAAIVMGISNVQIFEQVRKEYWTTLALLSLAGLVLFGGVLLAHHLLTRWSLNMARLGEREEQLAHLGLLAGGLAHEIRNPLNAMRFALRSLDTRAGKAGDVSLQAEMKELVEELGREVDGLEKLVTSFLSYARPGKEAAEPCDINQVCSSAVQVAASETQKHGAVVLTELPDPPIRTTAFPGRLRQVLVNVLQNAAQACGPGHKIVLRAVQDGRTVRILVEDDGPGVPPELRDCMFEPFRTGRKDGTGLGLAICRRLVAEMGGTISYRPREPNGSVFTVEIPSEKAAYRPKGATHAS
jgi:signal transduction histidine kinase